MIPLTRHAAKRCAQRGIRTKFLDDLIDFSDVDTPIGSNCRLLRISRKALGNNADKNKLGRYAVIWSDDTQSVVTVFPIRKCRSGRRYRSTGRRGGQ
jgi:hypothetical protein